MKQNQNKLLILVVILIVTLALFSGCSLFRMLNLTGTTKLSAPVDITLSQDGTFVSWKSVTNATGYEIYIDGEKAESVKETKYSFKDVDGSVDVQIRSVSASSKFTASDLSNAVTFTVLSRLVITGFQHVVAEDEFILFWDDNEYRQNYEIIMYEDDNQVAVFELYESSLVLQSYDSDIEYKFLIVAFTANSERRADSYAFEYIIPKNAAVSIPVSIEYNKKEGVAPVMDNPNITKVYLTISNRKTDITEKCNLTTQHVVIQANYLNTLPKGVYFGEFDLGQKKFILVIKDTRELLLEDITFVKNSDYAYVGVEVFANTIIRIELAKTSTQTVYDYINKRIIINGDFLDTLEEDSYELRVVYGQENITKNAISTVVIKTKPAIIEENASYNYYGQQNITISYGQRGDCVTSLVLEDHGEVASGEYELSKNAITLKKEFLLTKGNGTFQYCINTQKGSALVFTLITDIRNFAIQYSNYTYDKATDDDMVIGAIIANHDDFEGIYGALITTADYTIDLSKGIIINKSYMSQLSVGQYEFLCVASDGTDQYFTLTVINTLPKPHNVRFDYDTHPTDVYITFDCDGTHGHAYRLNGGGIQTISGRKAKIPSSLGFDKTQANTIKIDCSSGESVTYTKPAPDSTMINYFNDRYIFEGENRDKVIENQEQFEHLIRYMVFSYDSSMVTGDSPYSYVVEETVFLSQQLLNSDTHERLLQRAIESFVSPWGFDISLNNPHGNVYVIKLSYKQYPGYNTTYPQEELMDTRELLISGNRAADFQNFFIERQNKEQLIRNSTELIELPIGIRPVIAAGSEEMLLYEAAKDICREYISNDMDDFEKVRLFYYWLTSNVTYDSDALKIYGLSDNVQASSEISRATNYIDAFLVLNPQYSTELSYVRNMDKLSDMKSEMLNILKSMRVFAAEGALIDQKAVCNGIANAFLLLCKIEGIECVRVSGSALSGGQSENHAWNKVKIDNKWYIVDATWGRVGNFVTHKYLLVEDYAIFDTHTEKQKHSGERNIEYIARGKVDYYSTVIVGEYDLTIDSIKELNAVISALFDRGIRTIELKYNIDTDFTTAMQGALAGKQVGYQRINIEDIYVIKLID